jgi:hypothetical protein
MFRLVDVVVRRVTSADDREGARRHLDGAGFERERLDREGIEPAVEDVATST